MKKLFAVGVLAVAGLVVGCSSGKKPATATNAPVDIAPMPPAPSHDAQVVPASYTGGPVTGSTQFAGPQVIDPGPAPAPVRGGQKYTVKKGDTLWSIALRTYGDGHQYKRIVGANPSIKGDRLLVGQTITLP